MKWREMRQSGNVRDVRRVSGPVVAGGLGLGGLIIALLASALLGVDPGQVIDVVQNAPVNAPPANSAPVDDAESQFVRAVLGDTEDTWSKVFPQQLGRQYQPAPLILFSGQVESACGFAQAASGPFYCPLDKSVYLDMSFFSQIRAAAGPDADFARAYAIAHEVGHHVQNQLGILPQVRNAQQSTGSETQANDLQVRVELQADCLAGVWGNSTSQRGLITTQDVEKALNTAAQIGDDYLQKQSQGYIVPESFTHGSSAQRVEWFQRGLQSGSINQCDTFQQ